MKTDFFQSCDHCWVFQIFWHIEYSTFTASSFRIWNSSTGILSPPLALFVVMLSKAHSGHEFGQTSGVVREREAWRAAVHRVTKVLAWLGDWTTTISPANDSDAGRDWGQEERGWQRMRWMDGITDSMDKFGWTPRVGDRQGGLACCNSWGRKELDTTEQLNWTVPYSMFSLVIYCMHSINDVYVSIPISQFLPITFLLISICFFSAFVSQFLFCKQDHLYHFTIILSYIHINMQYLFSFFWLHCVW